jgi:propionyl-CoA carboxylase beta chain
MVKGISQMYITGPEVIKGVTGEKVSFEDLGGANLHGSKSGCSHFSFDSERECFAQARRVLSYLPQNNLDNPPRDRSIFADFFEKEESYKLLEIVPEKEEQSYDMKEVIEEIFDKKSFIEVQSDFAINSIVGFAKLAGSVVGVVANQTKSMAGTLNVDASDKISRFVRFCDSFNIPLINLVDTPGYLPGTEQEKRGIIRHGAKVLYAFAEATVPKISLVLRKAFGGAYIALVSRKLGYDTVISWPSARIAVMGSEQAVKIIYRKDLEKSKDPKKLEKAKIQELREFSLNPYQAARLGQIDMIIDPKDTRTILIKCLESLSNKREPKIARKHGNMPL